MPYLLLVALGAGLLLQSAAQVPPRDNPAPKAGTASVSGRVTDKDSGRPLGDISVHLVPATPGSVRAATTLTDADGRYQITGLAPGRYTVTAMPGLHRGTHRRAILGRPDSDDLMTAMSTPSLHLSAGDVRTDVDITLERTFAIEGRVVNEFGEPMAEVNVVAERHVVPGDYVIQAITGVRENAGAVPEPRERGIMPLRVDATDLTGLVVSTSPGASLRGRVRVEGGPLPASAVRRLRVRAEPDRRDPVSRTFGGPPVFGPVLEDLTFELRRVFGGNILRIDSLPDGWYFKQATYHGAEPTCPAPRCRCGSIRRTSPASCSR